MKQYTIDKFGGQNNLQSLTKIAPNEFVELKNADVASGSLKSSMGTLEGSTLLLPLPDLVQKEVNQYNAISSGSVLAAGTYAVWCSGKILAAWEMVTLMLPIKVSTDATFWNMQVYTNNGGVPGVSLSNTNLEGNIYCNEDARYVWRSISAFTSSVVVDYWIVFSFDKDVMLYLPQVGFTSTWKKFSASNWIDESKHQYLVAKSTASVVGGTDYCRSIMTTFNNMCVVGSKSAANSAKIDSNMWNGQYGGVIKHGDVNYICMGTTANGVVKTRINCAGTAWADQGLQFIPEVNVVVVDGIIALTYPNTPCCVPIGYFETDMPDVVQFAAKKFDCTVFQNNIVFAAPGITWAEGYPFFFQFGGSARDDESRMITFASTNMPSFPSFVNVFNNVLVFSGANTGPHQHERYVHRTFYSEPGELDSFDFTIKKENIFSGKAIIDVFIFGTQLLFSSHNTVKVFSGVFGGNAVLTDTAFPSFMSHASSQEGETFVLSYSGLYSYSGVFRPIVDKMDMFKDWGILAAECGASLFVDDNSKTVIIKKNIDPTTIILYDYKNGVFSTESEGHTYKAIGQGVYDGRSSAILTMGNTTVPFRRGISCRGITAESGWIDVDLTLENKAFQFISLEFSTTSVQTFINLYVYLENGQTYSFTNIDLNQSGEYYRIHKDIAGQGKRIKYKITSTNHDKQVEIHRVTFYYSPAKGRG